TELGGYPLAFRRFRLNGARRGSGYRHAAGRTHYPPRALRRLLLHALRRQPRDNLTAAGGRPRREAPPGPVQRRGSVLCPTAHWWKLRAASDHLTMRVGLI